MRRSIAVTGGLVVAATAAVAVAAAARRRRRRRHVPLTGAHLGFRDGALLLIEAGDPAIAPLRPAAAALRNALEAGG